MPRTPLFIALLIGLVSAPAAPQIAPPPTQGVSPRSLVDTRSLVTSGITVVGAAQVTSGADSARLTLQLFSRTNAPTLDQTALKPLADALIRAGADPNSITYPITLGGGNRANAATMSAAMLHPTAQRLKNGIATLSSFEGLANIAVQNASILLTVNNCAQLRAAARRIALERAHTEAEDIARYAGVRLGRLLAVTVSGEAYYGGYPGAYASAESCSYSYQLSPSTYLPFVALSDFLRVPVYASVTATYGMR